MDVFAIFPAILGAVVGSVIWLFAAPLLNVNLILAVAVGAALALLAYSHAQGPTASGR